MTGIRMIRALRPVSAGFAFFLMSLCLGFGALSTAARADVQTLDGTPAPIVRINLRAGDVIVRTWDRPSVAIDGDASLDVRRRTSQGAGLPIPIAIPQMAANDGDPALPPESFVTGSILAGARQVIVIRGDLTTLRGPVVVTVPNDTVAVYAHTGSGNLDVIDYRSGTLVALARNGRVTLSGVGGTVFAQTFRGPLVFRNATLDRVRARSLFGNVTFEHCTVRQIEATTVTGSIVYDGGSFAAGLARFESTSGNVAIGASGNVQYGAHTSGDGRIYTNFAGRAQIDARGGSTTAVVGDGGPVVTASTQTGSVFLYDGSLRGRQQLPPEWQPAVETLQRPGAFARPVAPGQRAPQHGLPPRFLPPRAFQRFHTFGHER